MVRRILALWMISVLFLGCEENDLLINVHYDRIQGLEPGNRVVFEQGEIGGVSGISYSAEGRFLAHLAIKKEFSGVVTEHSRFFITPDPKEPGKKAVEVIQVKGGGAPLENGATIEGSTRGSALLDHAAAGLEEGLGELKQGVDDFLKDLERVPESKQFKELEEELARLAEEMKRSGKAAQQKMQEEWLPKLQEELERLKERLREFGREQEVEPLEVQMKEIREI